MTALSEGWKTVPLASLCVDVKADIVDGPFGSNLKRSDYVTSGVPVLKIQNVKPNAIHLKKMDFVTDAKYSELERHAFRDGDIVMTKLGDPLGVAAKVVGVGRGLIVADLVRLRVQGVDTDFLCHQLNAPAIQRHINSLQKGTTRPRVNLDMIRNLPIVLPSLDEQRRIVTILEDHLSRLQMAQASVATLQSQTDLLDDSGAIRLREDSLKQGGVLGTVGDLATLDSGPAFKSAQFREDGRGIRLLRGDNIDVGALRWDRTRTWPVELLKGYEHLQVEVGDVILAMDRPIISTGLKIARVTDRDLPALLVQRVARITPISPTSSDYLYALLDSPHFVGYLKGKSVGTQLPHITLKAIRDYPVPLVDQGRQREFLVNLQAVRDESARLRGVLATTARSSMMLHQSLLRAAFSGQLTRESISV